MNHDLKTIRRSRAGWVRPSAVGILALLLCVGTPPTAQPTEETLRLEPIEVPTTRGTLKAHYTLHYPRSDSRLRLNIIRSRKNIRSDLLLHLFQSRDEILRQVEGKPEDYPTRKAKIRHDLARAASELIQKRVRSDKVRVELPTLDIPGEPASPTTSELRRTNQAT